MPSIIHSDDTDPDGHQVAGGLEWVIGGGLLFAGCVLYYYAVVLPTLDKQGVDQKSMMHFHMSWDKVSGIFNNLIVDTHLKRR